jgi:predicted nicotinamide N-methyase
MPAEVPFDEELKAALHLECLAAARWEVRAGDQTFIIHGLRDAADLLDAPDYAREFVTQDRAPYWAQLWPAAAMLAQALWELPPGGGRAALELGCGLGLVSIAAARRGWRVTASDYDARALRIAEANARANGVALADTLLLDWHHCSDAPEFDLILAADVLYEYPLQTAILQVLQWLLAPGGLALIADPNRGPARAFPKKAGVAGFNVSIRPTWTDQVTGLRVDGTVLHLRRS